MNEIKTETVADELHRGNKQDCIQNVENDDTSRVLVLQNL